MHLAQNPEVGSVWDVGCICIYFFNY